MGCKKRIITGSATRIGAAIAKSLAGHGIQITLHYNKSIKAVKNLKKELESLGSEVFLVKADLSIISQTKKIVPLAYKMMKGLDCLVNNASVFEKDDLINFNEKSFNKHVAVNLQAPAKLTQDFKKHVKTKKGSIINIIDQRIFKLTPYFFSYTLSKTGLYTLTKTSAMSLSPKIRVNGIAPGPTIKNKRQSKKHFKIQYSATPLRQQVDVNEICNAVDFFIKNSSITGQVLAIDSGQSLNWQTPDVLQGKE